MNQYRSRDINFIVESERSEEFGRTNFNVHEVMGELRARFDLDVGSELLQDIVEQCNLLVRIAARSGGKKVGNPLENSQALLTGAGSDRIDQFIGQRAAFRACRRLK